MMVLLLLLSCGEAPMTEPPPKVTSEPSRLPDELQESVEPMVPLPPSRTSHGASPGSGTLPEPPVPQDGRPQVRFRGTRASPMFLKTARRYGGQIKYCYEQALKTDPRVEGEVVLEISVANGVTTDARLVSSTVDREALEECMIGRVRRWRFPADERGTYEAAWTMRYEAP